MVRRIALVAALLAVALVPGFARAQTSSPPGSYFLVLGDSLAYGLTAPDITPDPTCQSPIAPGYVCIVYGYLKQVQPALQLENLAVREMDSCILVNGFGDGSPCTTAPPGGVVSSPLASAIQFIAAHQGQVGPITINVGGADLVPLLPEAVTDPAGAAAKLPALFHTIQGNLDIALSSLRAAAGATTQIVLLTQYNPLGGIASPPLPAGLPDIASGAIHSLNTLEEGVAAKYNVTIADVAGAFDAHPGGAALLTFVPPTLASGVPDIYPTVDGYRLLGQTVLKTIGDQAPLTLSDKLSKKRQKVGKSLTLSGQTISGASLKISLKLPKARAATKTAMTDNNGRYSVAFNVGKHAGTFTVKACATDPIAGRTVCGKKLSGTVS